MRSLRLLCLSGAMITLACDDPPVAPDIPLLPSMAKGAPPSSQRVDFIISDGAFALASDGKGTYRDGRCGVAGTWGDNTTHLSPTGTKIPKSEQASCAGIAPRTATVTLAVRHVSDDPHIDDAASPVGSGYYMVQNVKFGWGAALTATINASGTPFCGTLGLRFTSVTFPGTRDVVRDDIGGGLWHMYTRPYPDNIGYCENNGTVAYWHVSFDLYVQILGG